MNCTRITVEVVGITPGHAAALVRRFADSLTNPRPLSNVAKLECNGVMRVESVPLPKWDYDLEAAP